MSPTNEPSSSPARPRPRPAALSRRGLLVGSAVVAGAQALNIRTAHAEPVHQDPFKLGVASGDPLPDGVVLWTRLVADPYDAESMGTRPVRVEWEVATDERFRKVVRRGTETAVAAHAHSVHADVRGLAPGRDYWFRFRTGRQIGPAARTRTAPAPHSRPRGLRIGLVNCQDWQNGYWPAYTALAEEDLDVVVHVGDYIYEYDPSSVYADRLHTAPQASGLDQLVTLADYRARHAQYKTDPALQAAHAAFPWIVTWDDHEVENNYAGVVDEIDDTGARHQDPAAFARQRSAGYQAYYEHMPLRRRFVNGSSDYRLYRRFDFGDLLRLNVLDTRQYRTDQPGGFFSDFGTVAAGLGNTDGTLTGATQEKWLRQGLSRSPARWNVIAQQVMMSQIRFPNFLDPTHPLPPIANLDQWDGYDPARARFPALPAGRPGGQSGRARRGHPLVVVQRSADRPRRPGQRPGSRRVHRDQRQFRLPHRLRRPAQGLQPDPQSARPLLRRLAPRIPSTQRRPAAVDHRRPDRRQHRGPPVTGEHHRFLGGGGGRAGAHRRVTHRNRRKPDSSNNMWRAPQEAEGRSPLVSSFNRWIERGFHLLPPRRGHRLGGAGCGDRR